MAKGLHGSMVTWLKCYMVKVFYGYMVKVFYGYMVECPNTCFLCLYTFAFYLLPFYLILSIHVSIPVPTT